MFVFCVYISICDFVKEKYLHPKYTPRACKCQKYFALLVPEAVYYIIEV